MCLVKSAAYGIVCSIFVAGLSRADEMSKFLQWAPTPPMGWNSWDCYGAAVNEQQTRANADYMAEHLANHGFPPRKPDWYGQRT